VPLLKGLETLSCVWDHDWKVAEGVNALTQQRFTCWVCDEPTHSDASELNDVCLDRPNKNCRSDIEVGEWPLRRAPTPADVKNDVQLGGEGRLLHPHSGGIGPTKPQGQCAPPWASQ